MGSPPDSTPTRTTLAWRLPLASDHRLDLWGTSPTSGGVVPEHGQLSVAISSSVYSHSV
jgi:hypothetical protein